MFYGAISPVEHFPFLDHTAKRLETYLFASSANSNFVIKVAATRPARNERGSK
jgi:hypothetical protein